MVGSGFVVLDTLDMECKVYPYSSKYDPKNPPPLANTVTSYDHPDGNTYTIRVNQAIGIFDGIFYCDQDRCGTQKAMQENFEGNSQTK